METRPSVPVQEPMSPLRGSIMGAERFKAPRRSSIIGDTFKLQQVEHRVDGHERGKLPLCFVIAAFAANISKYKLNF